MHIANSGRRYKELICESFGNLFTTIDSIKIDVSVHDIILYLHIYLQI
jgi:hypothetical protein